MLLRELMIGVLICGMVFTGFVGCAENGTEGEVEQPPELPPAASMAVDLSAFVGENLAPGSQLPGENFLNAAGRVILLNTAIIARLALPTGVFGAAFSTDPVKQSNGSWLWDYSVSVLGQDFNAKLTGSLEGVKIKWSMRVTVEVFDVPLSDFEWYTGESLLDNTAGNWLFFDYLVPDAAEEIASIEWSVPGNGSSQLVISNIDSDGPYLGDVITYSVNGTTALISFYDASEDILADIDWDLITIAGSILVPNYNNGERAYWDADKQNTDPQIQ